MLPRRQPTHSKPHGVAGRGWQTAGSARVVLAPTWHLADTGRQDALAYTAAAVPNAMDAGMRALALIRAGWLRTYFPGDN